MNKNVTIKKSTLFYIILCFIGIFRIALLRSAPWELDANTGYDDLLQLKNADIRPNKETPNAPKYLILIF